jgi:hypothetical protein
MKNLRFIKQLFVSFALMLWSHGLMATNIQVSDIVIVERNDADKYIIVQFDLSWDYSFRVDDGANTNWDAAWVFMKYKDVDGPDNVQWGHATLAGAGHAIPGNYTSTLGATDGVNKGIFIYPSVIFANTAEINGLRLRWDYGEDGLLPEDEVDIRVFGVEMVYVPTGNFYVGSGGNETNRFHAGGESNTTPFQIGSASFQTGNSAGNLWATGEIDAGTLADGYPTGYNAFYMMKHNITQQAYVDFLNTLTYEQQDARIDGTPGDAVGTLTNDERRHKIKIAVQGSSGNAPAVYETENPYLPVNFLSPSDLHSYLDWAALRPFTELEYEKAARGPASPVPNEFAWGNTRAGQITSITDAGLATEAPVASGYQRDITIDHTKVNESLTDFPILVRFNVDNFDFNKCREDGFDFRFYDSEGNLLSYQRERHDFANKKAEYWVKVPAISSSQNTVITLEYGNLTAADGADVANVWDASFVSLWHLDEEADGTADEYKDSKGSNDGTGIGTFATNVEGEVGLAQEFAGAGSISIADDATLNIDEYVTISGWVKPQELSGITRTETSTADWDNFHSRDNLTTAADKIAVETGPGTGWRISNAIPLNDIKNVGSSSINWEAEFGYKVVEFTSSGTFSVPEGVTEVDVLVVGGGGGGGDHTGNVTVTGAGGGGAGQVVYENNYTVTTGNNISITVGAGGTVNPNDRGSNGGTSSFGGALTAIGGGGGGCRNNGDGLDGASGGGAGFQGIPGTGSNGYNGGDYYNAVNPAGGGGGGAVGQGGNASSGIGGNGGTGVDYSHIFGDDFGVNGWFAGGGGGGTGTGGTGGGDGGQGGGGQGGLDNTTSAINGAAGTGGGGGGGGRNGASAGDGGSGVVLIRYKDPQSVRIYTAINESADTPPTFENIQAFTADGTFTVPDGINKIDVLVVGGGGGGGGIISGGGGAGGVVYQEGYSVTPGQEIAVTVGAGGLGGRGWSNPGQDGLRGNNSVFGTITAQGGGGGARYGGTAEGDKNGGSGGGGSNSDVWGGSGTAGQGNNGGTLTGNGGNISAGGGGAGSAGESVGTGDNRGGNGGLGVDYSQIFGTDYGDNGWFASGGGGGVRTAGGRTAGTASQGGGGDGTTTTIKAEDGMVNTGGGGGGAGYHVNSAARMGGNGGSGVVIVRWGYASKGDPIPGINEGDDLTGKYLWVKQELSTNNAAYSPELSSVELEIKGEAILAGKGEDAYQLGYYDGNLRGYINNQMVSTSLILDEYQHLAITYNDEFQRVYVNGLLRSTQALTGNINTNATSLLMGKNFIGGIDEFRLSSSARSQAWLKAEYHSGVGDLVQIGGEAQVNNAVYGPINWGAGIGEGPIRVGFGASPTSSRTASGASYWGIMDLSGNLWETVIPIGRATGRTFTGLHGDGLLESNGLFNTANWPTDLSYRGGQFNHSNTLMFRVSDRQAMNWSVTYLNRQFWQGGRGVRTAP